MLKKISNYLFVGVFLFLGNLSSFAQTTINFNENVIGKEELSKSYDNVGFSFPTDLDLAGIRQIGVDVDGGAGSSSSSYGVLDFSGNSDFSEVDEIRIEAADINFYLDEFVHIPKAVAAATAPTSLSALPGVRSAHISFTEPADNGGLPIINYEYELDGSGTWIPFDPAAKSGAVTIENLTACTDYSVRLRAITSFGAGTESEAVIVTPKEGEKEGSTWTPQAAAEANEWISVTYGNGFFVAVAAFGGTNRVMTSPDGITWTARAAAEANDWLSVTYGNGLFVAVARDGTNRVMTSPDGITWTARAAAAANDWLSVTYGKGQFVAVSFTGTNQVMTSPDGITWTARAATENNGWRSVTYGNGLFVALSQTGTNRVMTSSDGITWTARAAAEANGWYSVTYGNGLFVAVADTGTNRVMTSPDGITWTARAAAEANFWSSVTYGNGLFVAVARTGTNQVMTSSALFAPDAPVIDGITPGVTSLSVAFTPPASSGASAISNYEYSIDNGANWITLDPVQTSSPIEITGLSPGTTYQLQLRAVNAQGLSCGSAMVEAKTLDPNVLTVMTDLNQFKIVGEADPIFTYSATGFVGGDTQSILTGALGRLAGEAINTYPINQGTLSAGPNYTINFVQADFEIIPAPVSGITFVDGSFVFDGTAKSLAITGALPMGTLVAYQNNNRTNVGTQEVTATITGSNFTTLVLKADLTITPAPVSGITFVDGSFVFEGTAKSLAITGALPQGTSVAYQNNGRTNIGTQVVTATITGSNYITLVLTSDLNITPKELGIVVNPNQSKTYGDADPELTFTAEGFEGTDTESILTGALVREAGENVGIYTIRLGDLSAGANYTIGFTEGSFAITPRSLEVTADQNQNKDFGDPDPVLTYSASNFGNGDDTSVLSGTLSRAPGQAVGFYAINLGTLNAGANYTIKFTAANFEIVRVDRDGDGVPDDIELMEGTNPNDPNDFKDSDEDGVPDYVEKQEGTDPTNPSDIKDSDGDGVPDFIEKRDGTDPNNPNDFKDSDNDGIPDYRAERAIVSFIDQSLEVAWGTPAASLDLPTQMVAVTGTGALINLNVVWNTSNYNAFLSSTYLIRGSTPTLPDGLNNDLEQVPIVSVTVLPKPAPLDVTLNNSQFEGNPANFFIVVGAFTVIDPSDDQHEISLVPGAVDNEFFEVIDGILFWSSAEEEAGRTEFTVRIEVIDRAGNVITKDFRITRTRTSLSQIEVPNTFTPNGDRVNDTWGVPALRYFRGSRLQVFDSNGNQVFYTEDVDQKWDGTFNGKDMPVGTYFWVIEVQETGELRRGILNLLRQ